MRAHMGEDCRLLMARYQAGEAQAFELLYGCLAPELPRLIRALTPGVDVDAALIEQIFLEIHRARRSYHPRKPFEPWLLAVVRHAVAQHARSRPRRFAELRGWFRVAAS